MANMSYCAFENTTDDMKQILNMLTEAETKADLNMNEYEVRAYNRLVGLCQQIMEAVKWLDDADEDADDVPFESLNPTPDPLIQPE